MAAELNREVEDWGLLGGRERRRAGGIWKRRSGNGKRKAPGKGKIQLKKNYKKKSKPHHNVTVVCSFCDIGAFWSNVSVVNSWGENLKIV